MKRSLRAFSFLLLTAALPARADSVALAPVAVPFRLLATKHIVIRIKINGKGPYRVIFDTGAPVSLINSKTAKETGLVPKNAPQSIFSLFGPAAQTTIRTLEIGALKAHSVPVIIMDHPTVEVLSRVLGPIEGILGFPFFARYKMTLDYQAKQLTFVPNGFEPADIIQTLVSGLLAREKAATQRLVPAALWGFTIGKDGKDEQAGVVVQEVLPGGAAHKAGLRAGDRLLSLDGRWTDSVTDCYLAASFVKPGTEVRVVIERQGKEGELVVKPVAGL
jgi:membrane-associated protease RseP (regulator of RpoE activity)